MSANPIELIRPQWPAPARVRAWSTLRNGGVSAAPWESLNLGAHVGDEPGAVTENRRRLVQRLQLPAEPLWLQQVHGARVRTAADSDTCADACLADRSGQVCVVMTADCLPVLFCNLGGSKVAAAHAGWRGLHSGVLEATVNAFDEEPRQLLAWLGPAIGPKAFEVGDEVRDAFVAEDVDAAAHFIANRQGHWLADLYGLARLRLARSGVEAVFGGDRCTFNEPASFYSYRRDGVTGRMASLIWLQP